ncbi:DnaD domain protein, partial [Liquorilactobacillus satsumensis]|uniref:DnaD domain-containing protein n=1 Tax=Liquorilactobacillus satsumensis TaxID=259059 RepID=UPI0039E8F1E3
FETLQKANISLNGITTPIFLDYVERLSNDVVDYAITKMCSSAARASWGYLKTMLADYEDHDIKTIEQVKQLEAEFEAKKDKQKSSFRRKKTVQKETLPDWANDQSKDPGNIPQQSEYTDEQRAELAARIASLTNKSDHHGTNEC